MTHKTFLTLNLFLSLLLITGCGGALDAVLSGAAAQDDAPDELTLIDLDKPSKGGFSWKPRISANGRFVAGSEFVARAGAYEVLNVWDAETGKYLRTIEPKTDGRVPGRSDDKDVRICTPADFSPDGSHIVVAYKIATDSSDKDVLAYLAYYVVLINAQTGQEERLLASHTTKQVRVPDRSFPSMDVGGWHSIESVRFSPDGKKIAMIVSKSDEKYVAKKMFQMLDVPTGKVLQTIDGNSSSTAFSRDGKKLLLAFNAITRRSERSAFDQDIVEHARVQVYEASTGRQLQEWRENEDGRDFFADISADGTKVATQTEKRTKIKIWDANTGKELRTIENEKLKTSQSLFFIPGTKNIVVSFFRDPALIIDIETGEPVSLLPPPFPNDIGIAHVSGDGRKVVTSIDQTGTPIGARVWTLPKGVAPKTGDLPKPPEVPEIDWGEFEPGTPKPSGGEPIRCTCKPLPCCACKCTCGLMAPVRPCNKTDDPDAGGCSCHKEKVEPPPFPTFTGSNTIRTETMTGVPTTLPPDNPPPPPPPPPPPVCTCSACCSCKCTCGKWTGRKCDGTASLVTGCKCHEIIEPPTTDFTLEGIWRQFVDGAALNDYEVTLDKATKKYEMSLAPGMPRNGTRTITNVQFDGKTWSFDCDNGTKVYKFVLTKVDNNTFEGIVDGNQKNKWMRIAKEEVTFTPTAEEQKEIDRFLTTYGRDIKVVGVDGETFLHRACYSDIAVAKYLISLGADVNAKDDNGFTPLHLATTNRNYKLVELLVSEGADVKVKNDDGETPLHYGAYYGSIEIVKYLVSKGAEVNVKNDDGETPLDSAKAEEHTEIVKYLESIGGKSGQ